MAEFNDAEQRLISKFADLKFDIKESENQENKFSSSHVRYDVTISKRDSDVSWTLSSGYQCNPSVSGTPTAYDILLAVGMDAESYIANPELGDFCEELGYEMKDIKVAINAFEGCKAEAQAFEKFEFSKDDIYDIIDFLENSEHTWTSIDEEVTKIVKDRYPSYPEPDIPEGYIKISELMDAQDAGDYGYELADYDGYISDAIFDATDSQVDIYTYDLLEWVKDNYEYVEDAIKEGLCDGTDFTRSIQCGQFEYIRQDIYDNLEDSLRYAVYSHLKSDDIYAVDAGIADLVDEMDLSENTERFSDLYNEVDGFIEEHDGVVKVSEFYEHDGYKTSHPKAVEVLPFVEDKDDESGLEAEAKDMSKAADAKAEVAGKTQERNER